MKPMTDEERAAVYEAVGAIAVESRNLGLVLANDFRGVHFDWARPSEVVEQLEGLKSTCETYITKLEALDGKTDVI